MAITLTEINNTLISMVDEQRETKSVMQSIADKITASAERDEKARLKFLNNKGSGASAGNIRSAAPSAAGGNSGANAHPRQFGNHSFCFYGIHL